MTKLDKYLELKKRVDAAQQKADQAEGAINEVMKQIKDGFGCKTLAEAENLLKQKRKQEADSKEKFETALVKFDRRWGTGRLDESE